MIFDMPYDILLLIIGELPVRDLKNLALSSKAAYRLLFPELFKHFAVEAGERPFLTIPTESFSKSYFLDNGERRVFNPLDYVRHFGVGAPIREFLADRCFLEEGHLLQDSASEIDEDDLQYMEIHERLMFRLSKLGEFLHPSIPDQSLQSFRWSFGCCIPQAFLGSSGYLPVCQNRITSLTLVLDGSCVHADSLAGMPGLRQLRHLAWSGIGSNDYNILRDVLCVNAHHLESLDLSFRECFDGAGNDRDTVLDRTGLFAPRTLHPAQSLSSFQLQSLKHLTLHNVSMRRAYLVLLPSFSPEKLRSLKIRDCRHSPNFLTGIMVNRIRLRLHTFEFVCENNHAPLLDHHHVDLEDEDSDDEEFGIGDAADEELEDNEEQIEDSPLNEAVVLSRFLESFGGLVRLSIYVRFMEGIVSASAIAQHRSTLRWYSYHPRSSSTPSTHMFDFYSDKEDLRGVLEVFNLEALGACIDPDVMRCQLWPMAPSKRLKLLHFRITGREYIPRNLVGEFVRAGYPDEEVPASMRNDRRMDVFENSSYRPLADHRFMDMEELFEFAVWAFGSDGLPNLKILAFGDFSHKGRYGWTQLLLCRREGGDNAHSHHVDAGGVNVDVRTESNSSSQPEYLPFRIMRAQDEPVWNDIADGKEFLQVCPEPTLDEIDLNDLLSNVGPNNDPFIGAIGDELNLGTPIFDFDSDSDMAQSLNEDHSMDSGVEAANDLESESGSDSNGEEDMRSDSDISLPDANVDDAMSSSSID